MGEAQIAGAARRKYHFPGGRALVSPPFVHVFPGAGPPCSMEREAFAHAQETWLCGACLRPRPGVKDVDVVVEQSRIGPAPLTSVLGCGVPVARLDFLQALVGPAAVRRDLLLGRVFAVGGRRLDGWVTWRGRRRVIVRGSRQESCRPCAVCGMPCYFALGERRLSPAPPDDADVFESDHMGLVVRAGSLNVSALPRSRDVLVEALGLANRAADLSSSAE